MTKLYRFLKENPYVCLAAFVLLLYFTRLTADSICGLFGIIWSDEGIYLLSAKNQALFGQAHFFLKDLWRPELIAPLLHHLALLTITPDEPLLWLRVAIALHVVGGATLMGWLAEKCRPGNGMLCFLWILLNPILFFYSHIGLSEGLQFFLMTLNLTTLYFLYNASRLRNALFISAIGGTMVAIFVLAKISAAPAGVALGIGFAASLYFNNAIPRKWSAAGIYLVMALAVAGLYFGLVIGDDFPEWWRANIEMEVLHRTPQNLGAALAKLPENIYDIAFFFPFMPVYALYFLSLIFAADRKKGFLFVLWIITISAIVLESWFGGEIRRNFFSLSLLSVLFGFCARDFFTNGIRPLFSTTSFAVIAGAFIILLHVIGIGSVLVSALQYADYPMAIFCFAFLLLLLLACCTGERWYAGNKQRAIVAVIALSSLMPMLFQAFSTPRTTDDIAAAIEMRVPSDAFIVGQLAPWFMERLKRRIILTNCTSNVASYTAANDVDVVASFADFYLGGPGTEHCMPFGYGDNNLISVYSIFAPMNQRKLWELSHHIGYNGLILLYEK